MSWHFEMLFYSIPVGWYVCISSWHFHVCSRSSPPWRLRAPGCPASHTPSIYYAHLPSLGTRISDIGLTWTHSSPVYFLPYIFQFPSSVPCCCINCFLSVLPVCWRCSCLVPCPFYMKCFTPRTCFVSPASCDRMQQPTHKASGSTGVPVGMVASALGRPRWNQGSLTRNPTRLCVCAIVHKCIGPPPPNTITTHAG